MRSLSVPLVAAALLMSACKNLPNLWSAGPGAAAASAPKPPDIKVEGVVLAHHPTPKQVARVLCAKVLSGPARYGCAALGGAPSDADLAFDFDLTLGVTNTAPVPVPLVDALVAFNAFPDVPQGGQHLGALCVQLCTEASCARPAGEQACTGGNQIKTAGDFANAAVGFLAKVATGQASVSDLKVQTVPSGGHVSVKVGLTLASTQVLDLLLALEKEAVKSVAEGKTPALTIPFSIEGSAWVTVQSFGSIGASFGPVKDTFTL